MYSKKPSKIYTHLLLKINCYRIRLFIYFFKTFIIVFLFSGCAAKISLSKNYFNKETNVGLILNVNEIGIARSGGQGLLDIALTQGKKYNKPLKIVNKKLNIKNRVNGLHLDIYESKGKKMKIIKDSIIFNEFQKFKATTVLVE